MGGDGRRARAARGARPPRISRHRRRASLAARRAAPRRRSRRRARSSQADDLPISEGKTDDIPTVVPSLQSTPSYERHAPKQPRPPTAPQDETDEPDECLLDLDGLARALERVQPGLGGKAEEVMNLFGMVPEREPLSVRRFRSAPTRLRTASVLFVSSRKKLPAVSERRSM